MKYELLTENKKYYLTGPLSQANVRNGNGRLYPKEILKPAILALAEKLEVLSEAEHPEYYEINDKSLRNCGSIVSITWDDETDIAYCKVRLDETTTYGKKIIEDIKAGESYGISTRGRGTLNESKVCTALEISTADIVKIPSCEICMLNLNENQQSDLTDILFESNDGGLCGCKLDEKSKSIAANYLEEAIIKLFR